MLCGREVKVRQTEIAGAVVVETARKADARGTFTRLFCANELQDVIGDRRIVQINHSYSRLRGTVRGLHYQRPPHAEMKFVQCLRGSAWDVIVDLRRGSPTFLNWRSEELSPDNARVVVVPEGCAHGFQTLQPDTELLYLHTEFFDPNADAGIVPTDPRLGIQWPLDIEAISEKDASLPGVSPEFPGLAV